MNIAASTYVTFPGHGASRRTDLEREIREALFGLQPTLRIRRLFATDHARVFRAETDSESGVRRFVIKCTAAHVGHRDVRVTRRWLPAVGLSHIAPPLVGSSLSTDGSRMWHVYADLGPDSLRACADDPTKVSIAVSVVVDVHARFQGHPLLAEIRGEVAYGHDALLASANDANRALGAARDEATGLSRTELELIDRLQARLRSARSTSTPVAERFPPTMVHGDLFPDNILLVSDRTAVRIIDWDHVGVGLPAYDLSELLKGLPDSTWNLALDLYFDLAKDRGLRLPSRDQYLREMHAAETERLVNATIWPALSLLEGGSTWAIPELERIDGWFEDHGAPSE